MGNLLKTRTWSAVTIGAVALLALSACQTTGPKDSSGRNMLLSEWKPIDASETDLNLPLVLSQKVTKIEYQLRDNALDHHRMRLDYGKGLVFTEYSPQGWYGYQTENEIKDIEKFKASATKAVGDEFVGFDEIREIKRKRMKTMGYAALVDVKNPVKDKCFFAKVAYRVKGLTHYDNDFRNVDTFVWARYCDPNVTIDDFAYALENIDLVEDREKYKAALAAK